MNIVNPVQTYSLSFDNGDYTISGISAEDVDVALALHAVIGAAGDREALGEAYREVTAQCFQEWSPLDITVFINDALRRYCCVQSDN